MTPLRNYDDAFDIFSQEIWPMLINGVKHSRVNDLISLLSLASYLAI
jgi:hypothetical protein